MNTTGVRAPLTCSWAGFAVGEAGLDAAAAPAPASAAATATPASAMRRALPTERREPQAPARPGHGEYPHVVGARPEGRLGRHEREVSLAEEVVRACHR